MTFLIQFPAHRLRRFRDARPRECARVDGHGEGFYALIRPPMSCRVLAVGDYPPPLLARWPLDDASRLYRPRLMGGG